ncbi:MAG: flavoprotein [Planctomycetota bacterium]|jgi:phosphopantothenoylcysteine decarboxylase/phosphopantothenate--cysteine ligase
MKKPCVLLGVTGSIAAYKSAIIASALAKKGVDVVAVMTGAATNLLGPVTLASITGNPVHTEMFVPAENLTPAHISLRNRADLVLVAPATANCMAKYANGIADDLLTSTLISVTAPVIFAPAMNAEMWRHPATQANLKTLQERGVIFVGPEKGHLVCDDDDIGRLAEPEKIVETCLEKLGLS